MPKVNKIWAREILDSRGIPTIEAACQLDTGHVAVSSVPAGTSTGSFGAVELRDNDPKRYLGKGVLTAVKYVNEQLGPGVWGYESSDQAKLDNKLIEIDGTENKSKMGANSMLSVSMCVAKAHSIYTGKPLHQWVNQISKTLGLDAKMHMPAPLFNMINGGLHGAGNLDFQEFIIIPASSKAYSESLRIASEIYTTLGGNLSRRGAIHSVGDEGGYAPNLFTNADALEVVVESIKETNYQLGRDVFLGLDVAASVFFKNGQYTIRDKSSPMNDDAMLDYYKTLNNQYHLAFLEDPFHEDAWESWKKLSAELKGQVAIVGDDLLATSTERVDKAIKEGACDGILVKPNQVGTVTETIGVIKMARDAGWKVVVSHRSGETNDWFMADFAVGVGADYVKFGAPARGERVAKYNRLLSIEQELQVQQPPAAT
jgi:enolase